MRLTALFLTLFMGSLAYGHHDITTAHPVASLNSLGQCYYLTDVGNKAAYPRRYEVIIQGDRLTYKVTSHHYICGIDAYGYLRWIGNKALDPAEHRDAHGRAYWSNQLEGQALMGSTADTNQKVATLGNHFAQIATFNWPISQLVADANFTEKLSGSRFLIRINYQHKYLSQRVSKKYHYPVTTTTTQPYTLDLLLVQTKNGWNFAE